MKLPLIALALAISSVACSNAPESPESKFKSMVAKDSKTGELFALTLNDADGFIKASKRFCTEDKNLRTTITAQLFNQLVEDGESPSEAEHDALLVNQAAQIHLCSKGEPQL